MLHTGPTAQVHKKSRTLHRHQFDEESAKKKKKPKHEFEATNINYAHEKKLPYFTRKYVTLY